MVGKDQFYGPPGTGNGGYVCGVLAKALNSWPVAVEGRKHLVGTALYDAGGICAARAMCIWFPV